MGIFFNAVKTFHNTPIITKVRTFDYEITFKCRCSVTKIQANITIVKRRHSIALLYRNVEANLLFLGSVFSSANKPACKYIRLKKMSGVYQSSNIFYSTNNAVNYLKFFFQGSVFPSAIKFPSKYVRQI